MKKAVIAGLLILVIGFVFWRMIVGELFHPAEQLAAGVNKEDLTWFTCSSCGKLFMAEDTTKKGYCPYCKFEMILGEDKRVLGRSVNEKEFIWFFSPKCGKVFFAFETKQMGKCPHCGESIDLTASTTTDLEHPPSRLAAVLKAHAGKLFLGALGLFIFSFAGIYILAQNQVILSLEPIEGVLSEETKIELSRRQVKKKKLTLGSSTDDDIILRDPSLKDIHCIFSFVRVGGKTHAYISNRSKQPVWVNDKPQYNPQLRDHDKIRIGDIMFEVRARA